MDYGKPFTFMFEDREWVAKILIGALFALLSIVLIGIPFVLGYALEVIRRVAAGREDVLPAWDDLGDKFVQGLILVVILFIFYLPATLLGSCSSIFLSSLADAGRSNVGGTVFGLLLALVNLLVGLYGFLIGLLIPAISIRYAMTRDFGATFNLSALWQVVSADLGNYVLVLLVGWVAGVIASLGVIACIIGVFVTGFWSMLVQGHLYGQYYRNFVSRVPPMPAEPTAPAF
ncbi:MAG: DUF4013 domain-containing protein [Anaerolineae bacterium]|nr:DUF4013 domain-containing protein [Anaerolineae bacterium]